MAIEAWLLFVVTEAVLCCSPGPAVLTVVSQGVSQGARSGIDASLGVLAANAMYFAISATGLLAIAIQWYELFFWIKWIGAVYLIWLGVRMWRTASRESVRTPIRGRAGEPVRRALLRGFAVQISNPKTLLFFGALLPQFVDAQRDIGVQIAILGVTSIAIEFAVLAAYATLGARAAHCAQASLWIDRAGGSLLIGAGVGLAALRRS